MDAIYNFAISKQAKINNKNKENIVKMLSLHEMKIKFPYLIQIFKHDKKLS